MTQTMLVKGKGPVNGSLRTITIAESNLNFVLKMTWAIEMQGSTMKENLLDQAQFALPGKTCY